MFVKNRLAVVMAEKGIRSVSELQRMVEKHQKSTDKETTISRRTLDKFYSNESNRLDFDTLATLCVVLNCEVHDLLYLDKESENKE